MAIPTNDNVPWCIRNNRKDLSKLSSLKVVMTNSAVFQLATKTEESQKTVISMEVAVEQPGAANTPAAKRAVKKPPAKRNRDEDVQGHDSSISLTSKGAAGQDRPTYYIDDLLNSIKYKVKDVPDDKKNFQIIAEMLRLGLRFGMKDLNEDIVYKFPISAGSSDPTEKDVEPERFKKYSQLRRRIVSFLGESMDVAPDDDEKDHVEHHDNDSDEDLAAGHKQKKRKMSKDTEDLLNMIQAKLGTSKNTKKIIAKMHAFVDENPASVDMDEIKETHVAYIKLNTCLKRQGLNSNM